MAERAAGSTSQGPTKTLESLLETNCSEEQFCTEAAKLFQVRPTEVALLRLEKSFLRFLFPFELRTVGTIPLSSSSSVAAHTALNKRRELFNSFNKVKHAGVFEAVKLGKTADTTDTATIQKLMSAPVMDKNGDVLGVIQISRKGLAPTGCGPDFTAEDLQLLEAAAAVVATAPFMRS